jgi:hypothetical protein
VTFAGTFTTSFGIDACVADVPVLLAFNAPNWLTEVLANVYEMVRDPDLFLEQVISSFRVSAHNLKGCRCLVR